MLKKFLQGRNRKRRSDQIKTLIEKREQRAELNQMKSVIQSFLNTKTDPWSWDSLVPKVEHLVGNVDMDTTQIITDDKEIHDELTQQANSLFAQPDTAFPAQMENEFGTKLDEWEELFGSRDGEEKIFLLLCREQPRANREILRHLAKTLCSHSKQVTSTDELEKIFQRPVSVKELKQTLRQMANTAPGLTGLTYGMLKLLPDDTLTHMLSIITALWDLRHIPAFWKYKWLNLIPKVTSTTISDIGNLRPLGLLEVTRKLYTAAVCNRLKNYFHEHGIIDQSQNGFVRKKSTTSEILQIINVISESNAFSFPIDLMTWDISKAFDSVSRPIQYWCWRRVGTPS